MSIYKTPNKGTIYCVHCLETGKKYIGQTTKNNPKHRINEHFCESKKPINHKFARAIKKYGKDNFIWGIVEECEIEFLNDREIYWIDFFDSFKNGYNTTSGGNQGREYCTKKYLIQFPDGSRKEIENLSKFCREHDLNTNIWCTLRGNANHHKGYKLIPQTEEEINFYQEVRKIREDNSRKGLNGEKNGRSILNWNKVSEIRKLHASKEYKNKQIADMFGIKLVTLEKIVSNKLWKC
jgi:group I intron endonuclease